MEPRWIRGGLFHIAGTLRTRWYCCSCTGCKCEILLALNDEPEFCIKEGFNEEADDVDLSQLPAY